MAPAVAATATESSLPNVMDLRRVLEAAGVPSAEIERRVQGRLRAIFVEDPSPDPCARCHGTGWVREQTTCRLHPFPITMVKPCACNRGKVRAAALKARSARPERTGLERV